MALSKAGEPGSLADGLIQDLGSKLWSELSDQIGRYWLAAQIRIAQCKAPDSRQLDLPGFEHVRIVDGESLAQYRGRIAALERRIRSYDYKRRTPQLLKADKRELREMQRLEPKLALYFAGQADMTIERAVELYQVSLETPTTKMRRERAQKAGRAGGRSRGKYQ